LAITLVVVVAVSQYIISLFDLITSPFVNVLVLAFLVIATNDLYKLFQRKNH